MGKGIGRLISFGIKKEGTRGTAESAADYYIPFSEVALEEKDTKILAEQAIGVIEDSIGMDIVKQWAEGNVKCPIYDKSFGLFLLSVLGSVNSALKGGESVVYNHTFSVLQNAQHPSLTMFLDDPLGGQDYKHALGVVSSIEIAYELGKYIEVTVNFKAKKGATATLTPSITVENKFLPQHLTFKIAANQAGLDAAGAVIIKNARITINQNIEDDDVLGNIAPADFLTKQLSIEGSVEAMWQNESDFKTATLAGTAKALRFDLLNSGVTIGTASNPQLKVDLHKVTFKELTRPIKINDFILQTVSFKAHYDTATSKMITAILTNLATSY